MTTRPTAHRRRRGLTATGAALITAVGLSVTACGSTGAAPTGAGQARAASATGGSGARATGPAAPTSPAAPTRPAAPTSPAVSTGSPAASPSTAPAATPPGTPSAIDTAPGEPAALPAGFAVDQVSTVSLLDWWVLGTGRDGSVGLARTVDGGRSWTVPTLPAALAGAARDGHGGAALGLAFADRAHGILAAGGTSWLTADGGAHWQAGGVGGATVLAVAATPDTLLALVDNPSGFGLDRTPAGSADLTPVLGTGRLTDTIPALATSGHTVVVVSGDRRLVSGDDARTFTTTAGPCGPDLGGRVAAAGRSVVIWCPTGTMGRAFVSTDAARTVAAVPAATGSNDTPAAPTGAGATLVWGGSTTGVSRETVPGAVDVTGRQFHGVSWLGFATPTDGFAVAAASESGPSVLWRTRDGGLTWTRGDLHLTTGR